MHKHTVILALLGSAALATPAIAQDNAWYVGVEGGALKLQKLKVKDSLSPGETLRIKNKIGYDIDRSPAEPADHHGAAQAG